MAAADDLRTFLESVVTTDEGWFELLVGLPPLKQEWYHWPEDLDKIIDRVEVLSNSDSNVYFSPHLFSEKRSEKPFALLSRTLVVDLDNADITDLRNNPTFLVESSPGRHQGFWVLKEQLKTVDEFETLSKKLSYTIENADHSGWYLGHKFRVPGSRNFKYSPPPFIRLIVSLSSERIYSLDEINMWVGSTDVTLASNSTNDPWIDSPPTSFANGPRDTLEKYKANIPQKVLAFFDTMQSDRSDALWALMLSLFRAGATRDEVFQIAKNSANNKFAENRYNADRDLAKDVVRAQKANETDRTDVKQMVQLAERSGGSANDRKRIITKLVLNDMLRRGEFITTDDGRQWYLHANAGRPIPLSRRSDQLDSFLDSLYGLNSNDGTHPFVTSHLANYTLSKGRQVASGILSHVEANSLLLHSGKADVFRITPADISRHPDGQFGVLFPWRPPVEDAISIDRDGAIEDWATFLLDGCFETLVDFTPEQATTLIRIWLLFVLFRDYAVSRPILALLGPQGSGKSSVFRLVYCLLYGHKKSLNAISTADDFDFLVASDPLVVFDNVDSWTNWIPDRFALSASSSDLVKRKLYTDVDTVTVKRQAVLGVTAHDPRFGRVDVVDRLIILNFTRRSTFRGDFQLVNRIAENRDKLWGGIIKDVQAILAEPPVKESEVPTFRISDFASMGARIAKAIGKFDEFKELIETLRRAQTAFSLGQDDVLIRALDRWLVRRNGSTPEYVSIGYLWEQFSTDENFQRTYKSADILSRRLWTMHSNLKSAFKVEYQYDNRLGVRLWHFDKLEGRSNGATPGPATSVHD